MYTTNRVILIQSSSKNFPLIFIVGSGRTPICDLTKLDDIYMRGACDVESRRKNKGGKKILKFTVE